MPELPEVETVKRELERNILNKHCLKPVIINLKCIQTPIEEYVNGINNSMITSLSREGKFLIIHLNNNHKILFHLRMEGKLFYEKKEEIKQKHLSLYIPFDDETNLVFYDSRKFGVSFYLKEEEKGPLNKLGLEPKEISSPDYLINKISKSNKCIKQLLLDQNIIAGLGNIYADEVCFACNISPMKKGNEITYKEADNIIIKAREILEKAIENNGSTIKSYQASKKIHGSFQSFLKVYGKEKELCSRCKKVKIERKRINGRSSYYCPVCQEVGISVAITGNIASGKTSVAKIFASNGYAYFSADKKVSELYNNPTFIKELKKEFSSIISNNQVDKNKVLELLIHNKEFNRKYLGFIYKIIKEEVNEFFIENNNKKKVFEIPLLFNAKLEKMFTYIVGVESSKNKELLYKRETKNVEEKILLDKQNKYKEKRYLLDYLIINDHDLKELEKQTTEVIEEIENRTTIDK